MAAVGRGWAPRVPLAVLAAVLVAALAVPHAGGVPARSISLDDVAAWLLSPGIGEAELVDGNTGAVVTRVPLGAGELTGAQADSHEFVADTATGTVRRINGATYEVTGPAAFGHPAEPLAVYPAGDTLFVVNRASGVAISADPVTLRTRTSYSMAARIPAGGLVTDGGSGLWGIDATTGDLEHVDAAGTTIRHAAVDPAHTQLVTAAGRPVAVDLAARRAFEVRPDGSPGAAACVDTAASDDTVSVVGSAGAAQIYVTSGRRGLLLISDLANGRCGRIVNLGAAGHQLGQPGETAGHVFIPDYSTGRVLVVDIAGLSLRASPEVLPPGARFELHSQGDTMFFNDPASARAGIITVDGDVRSVQKYDSTNISTSSDGPGADGSDGTGSPDPPAETADPASPSPTTAGRTEAPSQPVASPTSGLPTAAGPDTAGPDTAGPAPGPASADPGGSQDTPAATQPTPPTAPPSTSAQPRAEEPGVRIVVSASQAEVGSDVTLQAVLVDAQGSTDTSGISEVSWAFGDGATTSGLQVSHAWSTAGTYQVTASVGLTGGSSTSSATTITITAPNPPTASLAVSPSSGDAPLTVTADAGGSRGGTGQLTYRFDFGDAATSGPSTTATAGHTYTAAGQHTVTLTVTDAAGATAQATARITVAAAAVTPPTARLTVSPASGTAPLDVVARVSVTDGSLPTEEIRLTFSDSDALGAALRTDLTASHTYTEAGTYTVRLTVTDTAGNKAEATQTVTVTEPAGEPGISITTNGDQTGTIQIIIHSTGTAPLTVTGIYIADGDDGPNQELGSAAECVRDIAPGTTCSFWPLTRPPQPYQQFRIYHNAAGGVTTIRSEGTTNG